MENNEFFRKKIDQFQSIITNGQKPKIYEIDLKNLVSDPKKLKTYDTHISPQEAYARLKKGGKDPILVKIVAKDPKYTYYYARYVLEKPFPLGEPTIAKHPGYAYLYATDVLKGPFPLGEPTIYQDRYFKSQYERDILRDRPWTGLKKKKKTTEAIDLKNLVSDPTKLKTYDTHIGPKEAYDRLYKGETDEYLINIVAKDPREAYYYANFILDSRFPLGEPVIAKDPRYAYYYAKDILKGPFSLGEPAIAKDSIYAFVYANEVLKGPFPLGEPAIYRDSDYKSEYEREILKGRPWTGLDQKVDEAIDLKNLVTHPKKLKTYDTHISPKKAYTRLKNGDKDPVLVRAVTKSPQYAFLYASIVLDGPFPLGEPIIAKHPGYSYSYALYILKGPFTLGEPEIAKYAAHSFWYANEILKGPFPLGEPAIYNNSDFKDHYEKEILKGKPWTGLDQKVDEAIDLKNLVSDPTKLKTYDTHISPEEAYDRLRAGDKDSVLVKAVAKDPYYSFIYAKNILKGPFLLGEPVIAKDLICAFVYAKWVLKGPFPLGEPVIYRDSEYKSEYERDVLQGRPWTGLKKKKKKKTTEAIDLKKLVTHPKKLKTYKTHISPEEAYERLLKGETDEHLVRAVAKDPELAYEYAYNVLEGPFPLGEPAIATSAEWSYDYARYVTGPWPPGEPAIAKESGWAFAYARHVLKGPFPLGEPAIYQDPETSYYYKKFLRLLKKTNEAIDLKKLVTHPKKLKTYKTHISPEEAYTRLMKGETDEYLVRAVAKDPQYAYDYARYALQGPFPLGEPAIASRLYLSYLYALSVLNGPFPLGEPEIAKHPGYAYKYARDALRGPFLIGEPEIAKDPQYAYHYAKNVLKGPFTLGEPEIAKSKRYSNLYKRLLTKFRNKKKTTEAIDLKNLVSDPTKLKTYDTHLDPKEAYEKLKKGSKDEIYIRAVSKSTQYAFAYAYYVLNGRFPLGEPAIAKDPQYAYWYALNILKKPFPLGEPAIAKNATTSYGYAKDVLKGRFKLGEPAIYQDAEKMYSGVYRYFIRNAKKKTTEALDLKNLVSDPTKLKTYDTHISPKEAYERLLKGNTDEYLVRAVAKSSNYAFLYASHILKGPFPLGEPAIAKYPYYAYYYATNVLKGPFKLGEPSIFKQIYYAFEYLVKILKKPVPEIEHKIARSGTGSFYYAKEILKGPFKKGEGSIAGKPTLSYRYAREILGKSFPEGEYMISRSPSLSYKYALFVLKKPFPLGEPAIRRSPTYSKYYEKNVLKGRSWTHIRRGID